MHCGDLYPLVTHCVLLVEVFQKPQPSTVC